MRVFWCAQRIALLLSTVRGMKATRPETTDRKYLTPPEIARELGIDPVKVIGWINRGELRAVNVAANLQTAKRARWRVLKADLAGFLDARAAQPGEPGQRKRRRRAGVVEYV